MKGEKRKLEETLQEETGKKAKVEKELQKALRNVDRKQREITNYKKRSKLLAKKLIKAQKGKENARGQLKKETS